jgi:hypothetical protein
MKKVLLISIVISLIALTGCIYSPATHQPTDAELDALNVFANDTTATLDTVDCVILEALNPEWKKTYIDTVEDFLGLLKNGVPIATLLQDAPLVPGNSDKIRINVNGSYLSGYASITMAATTEIDLYIDVHGSITIWDSMGEVVDFDVNGMSPACAMVFKGAIPGTSVIREHYTYTLDAGTYYIRFKKAENAAYKSKNYFFGIAD